MRAFESQLALDELKIWQSLDSPIAIQSFLETTTYAAENANRCPLRVLRERYAHCLDGALFAAAALRQIGDPPLLVDMFPDPGMDDDHVLAIFKRRGRFGALAKSNFSGLRYREPVYRDLRELVMSYFEDFYSLDSIRTLRYYTVPLRLSAFDHLDWMGSDAGADAIERRLYQIKRRTLLSPEMVAALHPVDERTYKAGMVGTLIEGVYRPKH